MDVGSGRRVSSRRTTSRTKMARRSAIDKYAKLRVSDA